MKLEAIGFAANVVELVYRRLERTLRVKDPNGNGFAEATLGDAWAMVDWVHRLDGIVRNCPGLKLDSPGVQDYLNASSLVETPRNRIQHIASTFETVTAAGRQPWGYLTWACMPVPGARTMQVTSIGRLGTHGETTFVVKLQPPARRDVDHVSLLTSDDQSEIGITGQFDALARFSRGLEASVSAAVARNRVGILQIPAWDPADF